MGRRVTWIVVGAIAALAVAATVEALRGEPEAGLSPTTSPRRPAASTPAVFPISGREEVRDLLERRARSVLYVGDRNCRLRTVLLPAAEWRPEPNRPVPCRFTVDAEGGVHPDDIRIGPRGQLRANCHESGVDVFDPNGASIAAFRGACAPAWRPDGSLSFVRDGELVLATGLRDEQVLLSQEDVARTLGTGSRLLEAAWLDDETYAAAVRRGGTTTLAIFREDELTAPPSFASPRVDGLRATSRFVAARTGTSGPAVTFVSRAGREVLTVEGGHAVSWSPDGTVAAVAGQAVVVFVDPGTRERAPLALVATDLEWR